MPARRTPVLPSAPVDDAALDDALERVRELSLRLWAVRGVHRPRRGLLGVRCSACRSAHPCVTLQAVQQRGNR